ncbi:serine protease snake-like [Hyposmocoma kahamanoa]|uniref:serine protease snake-like n=1 Tax=Hyposmocoma kahamanoa TaxID=1477025 RepID=UPI000E6D7873|nr:serine protease snake-like [Hyposmocoma kahamanoa]
MDMECCRGLNYNRVFMFSPQPPKRPLPNTESSTLSEIQQILADYYADEMDSSCNQKLPEMPDFSKPGRRISEQTQLIRVTLRQQTLELNGFPPNDVNIIKIINHPQYKSPNKYNDISLMVLEKDVKFSKYVQPACLWRTFDTSPLGTKAVLTGWGVIETAHRTTSPTLQAAEVDILNSNTCDKLLLPLANRHWQGMKEQQLCASILAGGVDACQGDSGGPLQVRIKLPPSSQGAIHYIVGVTSFGFNCALPNTPGVYTRVSSFIDWIESIVWK